MFRPKELSMRRDAAVAALTMLIVAAPATSAWASEPADEISVAEAGEVLDTAVATVAPAAAPADAVPSADASVALHDLAQVAPELGSADRRRANALLSRPTDGNNDPVKDGYPSGAEVASTASANFCVFWVNEPGFPDTPDLTDANGNADGDGVPDFVEELLAIAEFSHGVEVAPGPMGWRDAKPDKEGCGANPGERSDIYLKQLGKDGLFGYQTVDPGQGRKRSMYGYMVLDDDFAKSEFGYDDPLIPAAVTFAHEYNHLLQSAYDIFQDSWVFESTATWTEEKVYPDINDYLGYVAAFAKYPGEPVTEIFPPDQKQSLKIYGAATWNHWLDGGAGGYGQDTIRRAWEVSGSTNPADFGLAAYDKAIDNAGGKGFSREWAAFTAATAEWRTGYGGFPDAAEYTDVKRKGSLKPGKDKGFKLDHTAYRLLDLGGAGGDLELTLEVERGVSAAVAIVARDGDELTGTVTRKLKYLKQGGRKSVTLADAGRFERITAVVVNADDDVSGFARGDWVYTADNAKFTLERG
jgi:hypothetical protein